VLLVDVPHEAYASAAAERLLDALDEPIDVAGLPVTIGASIGVAFDSSDTAGVDDLLGQADIAMYRAKAQGKGRLHVFSPDDLLDNEAAAGRVQPGEAGAAATTRRGLAFRKPSVRRPAFGPEPG
jgi:predicted signal transduction protein with EAL and GGDEF domain